ncbi:MAG TPA: PH domain-containing protein [Verrucomicrobiae bacterium]|nr:PH domain-containing protein [Verrucomicrobiae bacterium]
MAEFAGQREGEEVILVFRKHPIALRKGFYMLLIPFALSAIPTLIWPGYLETLWIALGGFLLGLMLFFYQWVGWYFTVYILTDQRLRQTVQHGLFGKNIIDVTLSKVQNISYNIPGFTGEVLGFGTIVLQTYVGDLILDKIHHPDKIYSTLQDAVNNATPTTAEAQLHEEDTI